MNLDTLRIFCQTVRSGSFIKAAGELRITQPAVSQAIQHLERDLGHKLIDRSHRPFQVTPHGQAFFAGCQEILQTFERTINTLNDLEREVVGEVQVASIYSIGLYHTDYVRRFMESHPKARVRLQYLRPNLVVDAVMQGDAHLGLTSYPEESKEIAVTNWKEERMVLVCPPDHRLAQQKSIKLEDLQGENFIAFDADLAIRKRVDDVLNDNHVEVKVQGQFDNVETLKQAIQVGQGVSILPEATVSQAVMSGTLSAVPFDPPALVRPLGIIYRRNRTLPKAATCFINLLSQGV